MVGVSSFSGLSLETLCSREEAELAPGILKGYAT